MQEVVRGLVSRDGLSGIVVLRRRFSGTAGAVYPAFCCGHCQAMSGDFPLQQELRELAVEGVEPVTGELRLPGSSAPVAGRHWCVDVGAGHCPDTA